MAERQRLPTALLAYIGGLLLGLGALLALSARDFFEFDGNVVAWLALTTLLALTQFVDLTYFDEGARFGLSAADAVFLPLVVGFPFAEVLWGATLAIFVVGLFRLRSGLVRFCFNLGQYGLAAAAAAWVWGELTAGNPDFTPRQALAAIAAVVVFAALTHIFTAAAISLAEKRSFIELTRSVAPATFWNLLGNVSIGLLFVASFESENWTVLLFIPPLIALYFGFRALLRQLGDARRVEHIHEASRSLAASPDLAGAISGFLASAREIVLSSEIRAIVRSRNKFLWTAARADGEVMDLTPLSEAPMLALLSVLRDRREPIVVHEEDGVEDKVVLAGLDAHNLVASPLYESDEVVGCLVALNRLGPEGFSEADVRLLSALANELTLTLGSYRLFDEVVEERERFGRIFDGSRDGICLLDGGLVVRAWNPSLERITGHAAADALGKTWAQELKLVDSNGETIRGVDLVDLAEPSDLQLSTSEGRARWVSVIAGAVRSGEDQAWVVLFRDVTAEHETEQAKSDFLTTISHEIRTPLTTMKGSLSVLSAHFDSLPVETSKEMVQVVKRGTDRLETLLTNLLVVTQIDTGGIEMVIEDVDLSELVRSRSAVVLDGHPSTKLDLPVSGPLVRADLNRLGLVLEHLIDNARKFGGNEGRVAIAISTDDGRAELSVSDQGPGVAAADKERIFERFTRLGDLLTRDTQGSGVGLFIARWCIEAMGGDIDVESDGTSGSKFTIELPLAGTN